ncbi:MAG: bifunctional DNA primase/polymerase [Lactococcus hircilactis]
MKPKEQALNCINRGFSVIAGYPVGKSERAIIKGTSEGTTDTAIIEKWFDEIPNRNIMINLRNSGLICIDLDQHQNGQNGRLTFGRIWHENSEGEILSTYVEKTPTGNGLHVFFKVPKELFNQPIVSELADGVEIKTHFTPIYPSKRHDGDYTPLNDTETGKPLNFDNICDCPNWLLEKLKRTPTQVNTTTINRTYGAEMWELFNQGARKGNRNNETNRILHYWRKIGIVPTDCMDLLRTFNSRTSPPLHDDELATIWKSVFKMK